MDKIQLDSQKVLELRNNDPCIEYRLFMSDEIHFHLNGSVNEQNYRYMVLEVPNELYEL